MALVEVAFPHAALDCVLSHEFAMPQVCLLTGYPFGLVTVTLCGGVEGPGRVVVPVTGSVFSLSSVGRTTLGSDQRRRLRGRIFPVGDVVYSMECSDSAQPDTVLVSIGLASLLTVLPSSVPRWGKGRSDWVSRTLSLDRPTGVIGGGIFDALVDSPATSISPLPVTWVGRGERARVAVTRSWTGDPGRDAAEDMDSEIILDVSLWVREIQTSPTRSLWHCKP